MAQDDKKDLNFHSQNKRKTHVYEEFAAKEEIKDFYHDAGNRTKLNSYDGLNSK